jgi:hypothetical protein
MNNRGGVSNGFAIVWGLLNMFAGFMVGLAMAK